jgi:hypothetical protein
MTRVGFFASTLATSLPVSSADAKITIENGYELQAVMGRDRIVRHCRNDRILAQDFSGRFGLRIRQIILYAFVNL